MKRLFFSISILIFFDLSSQEKIPFFIPPKDWVLSNPKTYTKYIKVAFSKNQKAIYRPTINLSIQQTDLSLDEYSAEAKKIHEKEPNTTYKILDKIDLKSGQATLSEIFKNTHSIDYKILQMILIKDKVAYILTAACKKEEITTYYPIFLESFKSFELLDDLFSKIPIESKKDVLLKKYNTLVSSLKNANEKQCKKKLIAFEKYLNKNYQNEGKYYIMLVIEKALNEIKDLKNEKKNNSVICNF